MRIAIKTLFKIVASSEATSGKKIFSLQINCVKRLISIHNIKKVNICMPKNEPDAKSRNNPAQKPYKIAYLSQKIPKKIVINKTKSTVIPLYEKILKNAD